MTVKKKHQDILKKNLECMFTQHDMIIYSLCTEQMFNLVLVDSHLI